ncbi:MAG: cell division protein FtsA [Deltaproteobacteria bacterium HGW-Deltaproteobacteria-22]|nr:MAG: cell division protein FtsA [Deltaproteobacteria bacterium HGW-Deltaproteobacteria-22]
MRAMNASDNYMTVPEENINYIAAMDIGSNKISLSIAQTLDGRFDALLGVVHHQCQGITSGRITNLEAVTATIRKLLCEAVEIIGFSVTEVFIGITDPEIAVHRNTAMVAVGGDSITSEDIADVLEAAETAMPLRENEAILHVIPEQFLVNGHPVDDPVGRSGVRLDVETTVLTVPRSSIVNVDRVCRAAGLTVRDIFFSPLGTLQAVTHPRQRQLGVLLLDIGAGTTDVVMMEGDRLRYCDVVPIGGQSFTESLANGLRCLREEAETIKIKCGMASPAYLNNPDLAVDSSLLCGSAPVTYGQVSHILESRISEILHIALNRLHYAGIGLTAPHSIVITGGTAQLNGLRAFIQELIELPVEVGFANLPAGMFDLARQPVFSSSVGLVMYASTHDQGHSPRMTVQMTEKKNNNVFKKLADFFGGFFD